MEQAIMQFIGITGMVLAAIAWIWIVGLTFRASPWVGLACLLVPAVALLYALIHASKYKIPLTLCVLGIACMAMGFLGTLTNLITLGWLYAWVLIAAAAFAVGEVVARRAFGSKSDRSGAEESRAS